MLFKPLGEQHIDKQNKLNNTSKNNINNCKYMFLLEIKYLNKKKSYKITWKSRK